MSIDISTIKESYDTSNPIIAEIIKAKEQRLKILLELNKQQEKELSSLNLDLTESQKKKTPVAKKRRQPDTQFPQISLRRSTRIQNSPIGKYKEEGEYKPEPIRHQIERPPNDYGPMPGVEVGFHWETRMECSLYGVHRPTVAGIHGGPNGAYSIAISGGYPEDIDDGDTFIYTGAGGRDLKGTANNPKNLRVAPQTKDQQLEGTNLSLVKSIESKLPIRVIRGYKSPSIFAPETGYRYDGLYQVVDYWEDVGKTGYRIYRFKMERIKDQAPPPWASNGRTIKQSLSKQEKKTLQDFITAEEESGEFKENIRPDENEENDRNLMNGNDSEIIDVDREIETCLNFFIKVTPSENHSCLKDDSTEENFLGWDTV